MKTTPPPRPPAPGPALFHAMRYFALGGLFLTFGTLWQVQALIRFRKEARELREFTPVPAIIAGDPAEGGGDRKPRRGRSGGPIRFRYEVDGVLYESARLLPGNKSAPMAMVRDYQGKFPPGTETTAYHDPRDPRAAFLVRRASSSEILNALVGAALFSAGLGLTIRGGAGFPSFGALRPAREPGWWILRPVGRWNGVLSAWAVFASCWWLSGAHIALWFLRESPGRDGASGWTVLAVYAAAGIPPLRAWLRRVRGAAPLREPEALFRPAPAAGEPFRARVVWPVKRTLPDARIRALFEIQEAIRGRNGEGGFLRTVHQEELFGPEAESPGPLRPPEAEFAFSAEPDRARPAVFRRRLLLTFEWSGGPPVRVEYLLPR